MIDEANTVVRPMPLISLFDRLWSLAVLAAAVIVNLAWIGFLGYCLFKLVEPALS
jgi:hypothetical protein